MYTVLFTLRTVIKSFAYSPNTIKKNNILFSLLLLFFNIQLNTVHVDTHLNDNKKFTQLKLTDYSPDGKKNIHLYVQCNPWMFILFTANTQM